jgi:hypothetical protein
MSLPLVAQARPDPDQADPGERACHVVEDPSLLRWFAQQMIEAHHRRRVPGAGADQCSCGRPFMLCPIGPVAERLRDDPA